MLYFCVLLVCLAAQLCLTLWPFGLQLTRILCPWDFSGKNTGVACHFLLQGIFPTLGSNPGLLHCRQILYQLSYEGSPNSLRCLIWSFTCFCLTSTVGISFVFFFFFHWICMPLHCFLVYHCAKIHKAVLTASSQSYLSWKLLAFETTVLAPLTCLVSFPPTAFCHFLYFTFKPFWNACSTEQTAMLCITLKCCQTK